MKYQALVIPAHGPVTELELTNDGEGSLGVLQAAVGGLIQALPILVSVTGRDRATVYINEEGKFDPDCEFNSRATDFLVPGVGLHWGDCIVGSMVVAGFNPVTGRHAALPPAVAKRVRLIEREAGS
jgi:hypothetical protein